MTLANKILIAAGKGILTITDKHMEQFNTLLLDYYNTNQSNLLKGFLYENAIQGIEIQAIIKAYADSKGESINGFVNRAINEAMNNDK